MVGTDRMKYATVAMTVLLAVIAGVSLWWEPERPSPPRAQVKPRRVSKEGRVTKGELNQIPPDLRVARDPGAPDSGAVVYVIPQSFDDEISSLASQFTGQVENDASLSGWLEAVRTRGERAGRALRESYEAMNTLDLTAMERAHVVSTLYRIALIEMHEGRFAEAANYLQEFDRLRQNDERGNRRRERYENQILTQIQGLLGICALRRGELENCVACVGPSSCLFPLSPEAEHAFPDGSREAMHYFGEILERNPGDLRARWLLNLAAMTVGAYPEELPTRQVIPLEPFESKVEAPRFVNVAVEAGLTAAGPGNAGGSVFDDFNGDGWPDLFVTSYDPNDGARLFVNQRDGTFQDRSTEAGLDGQGFALNVRAADYDNDGDLDVLLLRGAWERPAPMSLLRNDGEGKFEDVTAAAGLGVPIASESAEWGDYDRDGHLDLFVCGEFYAPSGAASSSARDPRNRCRLYRNRGNGTFVDVSEGAGLYLEVCGKGAAWADFDRDGWPDLFVSNMGGMNRLYRNRGDGTFEDARWSWGLEETPASFSCIPMDFNNDGFLDLFLSDFQASPTEVVASRLGIPVDPGLRPRLYVNTGGAGFRESSLEAGLDQPMPAMGLNSGDVDADGDLDIYLGTGAMSYSGLVPNLMLLNQGGRRFEDVTATTGTGHLQKGHGVSFADYDRDGDLDLFVVQGGAYPGDKGFPALFRNPGQEGTHSLQVRLLGTRSNRSAIGAEVIAEIERNDGPRRLHRWVGANGSFGGNSLTVFLGLGEATAVDRLTVRWPIDGTEQTFEDVQAGAIVEIREGEQSLERLEYGASGVTRNPTRAE